jgi:hypothetical protein
VVVLSAQFQAYSHAGQKHMRSPKWQAATTASGEKQTEHLTWTMGLTLKGDDSRRWAAVSSDMGSFRR